MKVKFYQILSSITFKVYAHDEIPGIRSQESGGVRRKAQGTGHKAKSTIPHPTQISNLEVSGVRRLA
jgi:hypothetical protein